MHLLVCYLNKLQNARCNDKDSYICLHHRELLNYQIDLFKTDIFRNRTIQHCWHSPLFSVVPSQKTVFHEIANVRMYYRYLHRKRCEVHILASLGLRWWQYMVVSGAVKNTLIPRFQLFTSGSTISFQLRRR